MTLDILEGGGGKCVCRKEAGVLGWGFGGGGVNQAGPGFENE